MGRNHHVSLEKYAMSNSSDSLINRVYWFINNKENYVVTYAKIRAGIIYHQHLIDKIFYRSRHYFKYKYPQEITRRLKNRRKELSRALNALDKYMNSLVRSVK